MKYFFNFLYAIIYYLLLSLYNIIFLIFLKKVINLFSEMHMMRHYF